MLSFEWASAQSPGDLWGLRDINTNCIVGVRCVPTAALSPPVNDYGGRHQYKNSRLEGSQVRNLMKSSGARPTFGVVTWLSKAASKMGWKPQYWYTGPHARTEPESSRLGKRFQLLLEPQHIVWNLQGALMKAAPDKYSGATFNAVLGRELVFAL